MSRLTEGTTEEYAERKRRDRLTLLHLIQNIRPIGEPFNDALFDCATVLAGGEAGERAYTRIQNRLRVQNDLVKAFQTSVIVKADELGMGNMEFEAAAEIIGEEFGKLRDVFLLQLREITQG